MPWRPGGVKIATIMLFDKLTEYASSGAYPMHMPGHKRSAGFLPGLPCGIDITEIHGFDDLHEPRGILLELSRLAAGLYGSARAFPLINGSTAGILASVGALAGRGGKILMARNCHASVHNAARLFGLAPVYIDPETDESTGISGDTAPGTVEAAIEGEPGIEIAVVTSPTYEGVVSDINAIADIVHKRNIPLLVDSAHGAHLGFSPMFPPSAVSAGADAVVMSLHKTLPALTQCSLLHVSGVRADAGEFARLLSVFQTSSPSYVLMASIDRCLRLLESDGGSLFSCYEQNLADFSMQAKTLKNLSVIWHSGDALSKKYFAFDPGKIVIITEKAALTGAALSDILRNDYDIELEKACGGYAIAITSICDSPEGFRRLADALACIDNTVK